MDIWILDKEFTPVTVLDTYSSIIWTEKYSEYGDFEIYAPVDLNLLAFVKIGYYLQSSTMETVMIVESILIDSDVERGNHVTIKGRSLESILDRRIVWKQTRLRTSLQEAVKKLLEDAIISPEIEDRKIENFEFQETDDPYILSIESIDKQFTGDNLYDAIVTLCQLYSIGFKVTLSEDNKFIFQLYNGTDRTYEQNDNPYVVFSPSFENIINSSYSQDVTELKTITLVAGEEEGTDRVTTTVSKEGYENTGLERREMFTDARDISSTNYDAEQDEEGNYPTYTEEEYDLMLSYRGFEYLYEHNDKNEFEGQVDSKNVFLYNRDFFKGDIVQIVSFLGNFVTARIAEVTYSQDESGEDLYPTFELLDEQEVE